MLGVPYCNYLGAFIIPDYTMLGVPYCNFLGAFIIPDYTMLGVPFFSRSIALGFLKVLAFFMMFWLRPFQWSGFFKIRCSF